MSITPPGLTTLRRVELETLYRVGEILGAQLNTIHNLHYYQMLMRELRSAIADGKLPETVASFHAGRAVNAEAAAR